ncbi:MAG: hypothetical protein WD768_22770 [Phycisphaeraceae bacterium]
MDDTKLTPPRSRVLGFIERAVILLVIGAAGGVFGSFACLLIVFGLFGPPSPFGKGDVDAFITSFLSWTFVVSAVLSVLIALALFPPPARR